MLKFLGGGFCVFREPESSNLSPVSVQRARSLAFPFYSPGTLIGLGASFSFTVSLASSINQKNSWRPILPQNGLNLSDALTRSLEVCVLRHRSRSGLDRYTLACFYCFRFSLSIAATTESPSPLSAAPRCSKPEISTSRVRRCSKMFANSKSV